MQIEFLNGDVSHFGIAGDVFVVSLGCEAPFPRFGEALDRGANAGGRNSTPQ